MKTYNVVSIVSLEADSSDEAIVMLGNQTGDERLVILHVEEDQARTSIGQLATKALAGIAAAFSRTLVIRCDNNFRPYVMDYPKNNGRPYDVSLNVSEIVGHYNDR